MSHLPHTVDLSSSLLFSFPTFYCDIFPTILTLILILILMAHAHTPPPTLTYPSFHIFPIQPLPQPSSHSFPTHFQASPLPSLPPPPLILFLPRPILLLILSSPTSPSPTNPSPPPHTTPCRWRQCSLCPVDLLCVVDFTESETKILLTGEHFMTDFMCIII